MARHGRFVTTYDPNAKQKKIVRSSLKEMISKGYSLGKLESDQVFEVGFTFCFSPNKSDSASEVNLKLWNLKPHTSKPDLDNLQKFYLDCGNEILWPDDALISKLLYAKKMYSKTPYVEIEMVTKSLNTDNEINSVFKVFSPEKLEEFLDDIRLLSLCSSKEVGSMVEAMGTDQTQKWMADIGCLLMQFSMKYSDEMKKIKAMSEKKAA